MTTTTAAFPPHLVSVEDLSRDAIEELFALGEDLRRAPRSAYSGQLQDQIVATLFYQPSTRTRVSFESAALRLGARCIGFADAKTTRAGDFYQETLKDVVTAVGQLSDCIVLRHHESGAARRAAEWSPVPVVNAGDGYNEHPTQALGDVWTMHRALGGLDGATIGLVGDVSIRSLRAISLALSRFRLERLLFLPAPGTVCPPEVAAVLDERGIAWQYVDDVADLLRDADAVETIGVRHPDHHLPRQEEVDWNRETPRRFRIDRALIEALGTDVPILHPGARKDELATDVDDLPNALYAEQVRNGLWQRMAVLARLCGAPLPLRL